MFDADEPVRGRGIRELVLRRGRETPEVVGAARPGGYGLEDPDAFEGVAVRDRGRLGRLRVLATGGGVADLVVGRGGRGGSSVRPDPPLESRGVANLDAEPRQVGSDHPLAVEFGRAACGGRVCTYG